MSRKSKLTDAQREELNADLRAGATTLSALGKKFGISISSVQHYKAKLDGVVRKKPGRPKKVVEAAAPTNGGRGVLQLLGRMIEKQPGILKELGLMRTLTEKYPDLVEDCL